MAMSTSLVRLEPAQIQRLAPWGAGADPATRYLARLKGSSVPAQRSALEAVARITGYGRAAEVPWHYLTITEADALVSKLKSEYAPRTVIRMLAAVRGVLDVCRTERWLVTPEGVGQAEWYGNICERLTAPSAKGKKYGRVLTNAELLTLKACCDTDGSRGLRDAAILALGVGAGLRREEMSKLLVGQVNVATGRIDIEGGKGGKDRTSALPPSAMRAVAAWLEIRKGTKDDSLLVRIQADGTLTKRGLSPHAVWEALVSRQKEAEVEPFKPHDLRRAFATRQLRAKTPLGDVQRAMGHARPETTEGYDLSELDEMMASVQKVDLPW